MYLGVDYYPEHWDENMLTEDLDRIVEIGANTIRIGEFAWHMMEQEESKFDFSFFDNVINEARKRELHVIFGTPTATFPAWLKEKYPSILSEDINGMKREFGGRRQYCFSSDEYVDYASKITEKLLSHYQDEESIVAWQIDNEIGHEGSDMCYCNNCKTKFQIFLKDKYKNIDELNEVYGTIFWGQTYNNFEEIPLPINTITTHNPSMQLDHARFRSYIINKYAVKMIDIVNEYKRENQKVTHNFFGGFFNRAFDQNVMSEELDVVSYDNYPVWGGLEKPLEPAEIAMTHDYIRGLKQKNYWILEELMGAQGHTEIGYLPKPDQGKLWAFQAMSKGCESLLYFRWRTMTRGAEQYCQGILNQDNKENRKYNEVKDFFKTVNSNIEIFEDEIVSDVALVYDYDNRWSWHSQCQSAGFDYTNEVMRVYRGFYNKNISMDVISSDKDLSNYKVLIIPVAQIIDDKMKEQLENHTKAGGTVIFTFRTGIKDRDNNILFGDESSSFLSEMCGIEVFEYESLGENTAFDLIGVDEFESVKGKAEVWRDLINLKSAKALFRYDDKFFDNPVAITENRYNNGYVYYIGCGAGEESIDSICNKIINEGNMKFVDSPEGVEVSARGDKTIIMNHNDYEVSYDDMLLKAFQTTIK